LYIQYVIASAQVGAHNEKRTSYGHSMVVDPWGKVLIDLTGEGKEPEIAVIDIDLDFQEKIKKEMPLQRRMSVNPYSWWIHLLTFTNTY
jgi:predicted amidohydrolase